MGHADSKVLLERYSHEFQAARSGRRIEADIAEMHAAYAGWQSSARGLVQRTDARQPTAYERIAAMALLTWNELAWDQFVAGLEGYRDYYSGKSREDETYLRCLNLMQARPLRTRAEGRELVDFLNRWACRLSSVKTPGLIAGWADGQRTRLEELEPMTIVDAELPDHAGELGSLHDDLIARVKAGGVPNMSDAAASKTLHLLIPDLFVMWDKEIKRSAPGGYGSYQRQMHELAGRLTAELGVPAAELEMQLQQHLGYRVRKPLTKYLDEYNWFEAVGREQLARR